MTIFNEFVDRFLHNNSTENGYRDMVVNVYELRKNLKRSKLIPATVVNERDNGTETKEYMIKLAPYDQDLRKKIPYDKLYHREWFLHMECLPEYEKFEKEKCIRHDFRFKAYPICYAASLKPFEESLILENLEGSQNFQLWDKRFCMNGNHIKLVLREYAKFHAISFAIRKQRPALMKYIEYNSRDNLLELLQKSEEFDNIEILCDRLMITDKISKNDTYMKKLKYLRENLAGLIIDCIQNNKHNTRNVLLHGGNCFNDMQFCYKDPDTRGMPSEVKFVDWQNSRIGSQIQDISSFFYTVLEGPTLLRFEEFLKYYHKNFLEYGEKLGMNLRDIYPYEEVRADWSKYSIFGLGLAILFLYKIFMGRDCCPKIPTPFEKIEGNEEQYFRRIIDVFQHFVDEGFI
ncbi:hypothetical protein HHI36_001445 [Cryptolaemus montrouzieri]|uniref:CHK kinase-like domain-containing protein n=1 Tax=Cryptolaemus montrouzieri TaxID=559131 RepID=A0ABD2P804_9CUCU